MRTCATCGTEVDEDASFCPSCGQPLAAMSAAADIEPSIPPAAPAWGATPDDPDGSRRQPTAAWSRPEPTDAAPVATERPDPVREPREAPAQREARAPDAATRAGPVPAPAAGNRERPRSTDPTQINLPLTWPVTLSGWLIGIGALAGALSLLLDFRLFDNPITILLLLLLLGVAASVFFAAHLPPVPQLRLIVLGTILIALGVALDRIGFGGGAASAILLLAMGAAAVGVVLVEIGRDRPWAGPTGQG